MGVSIDKLKILLIVVIITFYMIAIHSSLYLVIHRLIASDVDLSKISNVKEIDLKVER